jgi:ketosteroid isomerase-like protein
VSAKLDLVRSLFARWRRGDFSSTDWADPEIEYVHAGRGAGAGSWRGLAGLAEGWLDWISAWDEFRAEPDEFRELDDERVLVLVHFSGRGRTSGVALEDIQTKAANVIHVRDGKVTRLVLYPNREIAFADLGLPPETGSERS